MAYRYLTVLSTITAILFALPAQAQPRPNDLELVQMRAQEDT